MGSVIEGAASAAQGYSNGFTVCGVVTLVGGLIGLAFLRPESERARIRGARELKSRHGAHVTAERGLPIEIDPRIITPIRRNEYAENYLR